METFTLDTSGEVFIPDPRFPGAATRIRFSDLSPFEQGYIEALFASLMADEVEGEVFRLSDGPFTVFGPREPRFSDLAPETLAAMLKDCASFANIADGLGMKTGAVEGKRLWIARRHEFSGVSNPVWATAFPPLTLSLGDDGKIYQREGAR